jgi:predicted phage-related endonuclease
MYVTGIHDADLAWLVQGRYFGYANIPYDEEFAEFIAARVTEFWNECILKNHEPDLISVADWNYKGSEEGKTVEADSEAVEDIGMLREVNASIAELTAKQEALKDKIKMFMQDAEVLAFNGDKLATWKSGKKGRTFLLKKVKGEE